MNLRKRKYRLAFAKIPTFKIGIFILLLYSIIIFGLELISGQQYVREYLDDIKGEVIFYGINTTINTILLTIISYTFILCKVNYMQLNKGKKSFLPFLVLQFTVFLYLAIDERFIVHERIGYILGIADEYLLVLIGVFELIILYKWNELNWTNNLKSYALYFGGLFFGIMILIDYFGGQNTIMRLSLEEISKTWAIFFLFIYSLEFYKLWQINSNLGLT